VTRHVPALVIGGGISGLVCGYALRKGGIDAEIIEASPRPGGVIQSITRDGFLLELGPQSFSGTAALRLLCDELGISNQVAQAPSSAPRYVLVGGRLQPVPLSPPALLTSGLIGGTTKWALLRDIFGKTVPPEPDESVADFVRRKFSAQLLDRLVGPFVSGVYAGDPEHLSVRSAFPQLYEAEKTSGSIVRGMMRLAKSKKSPRERPKLQTFRDGNETLIQALATRLGPALRCGVSLTSILQGGAGTAAKGLRFVVGIESQAGPETMIADSLILAVPAKVASELLKPLNQEFESALGTIEYAPVAVVSLGYRQSNVGHTLDGFGFLAPRSQGLRTLGTVWNSSLFPSRAPSGHALLTSFVGGATDPQACTLSAAELVETVHREIAPVLSIPQAPVFSNVQIYEQAIPQYNLGYGARLASLERALMYYSNLRLVGNYIRGPAIGACVEQALAIAEKIGGRHSR
jgi:protoporphyrinogen/coproporphyrinogen III oxidase